MIKSRTISWVKRNLLALDTFRTEPVVWKKREKMTEHQLMKQVSSEYLRF